MIAETKSAARRIADHFFYVENDRIVGSFLVRSIINGARMAVASNEAAADRRALRLAVCKMRLAKEWPGLATQLRAVLANA